VELYVIHTGRKYITGRLTIEVCLKITLAGESMYAHIISNCHPWGLRKKTYVDLYKMWHSSRFIINKRLVRIITF